MSAFTEKISVPVLGLVLAGIGVISPIAWDWWTKRSQLTIDTKSVATVASNAQPIQGLELFFNGKKISAVNRVHIELRNTGRTPVTKEDIVSPIAVRFGDGEVLDAKIARRSPENLDASLEARDHLTISFSLLNPNEYLEIDVLTTSQNPTIQASSRIKNISQIEIVTTANSISIRSDIAATTLAIGILGLLFAAVGIAIGKEVPKKIRASKTLQAGTHPIVTANSHAEAREHLYSDLDFLSDSRRKKVDVAIDAAPWPLDSTAKEKLCSEVLQAVKDEDSVGPALLSLALSCIAFWYAANRLLS